MKENLIYLCVLYIYIYATSSGDDVLNLVPAMAVPMETGISWMESIYKTTKWSPAILKKVKSSISMCMAQFPSSRQLICSKRVKGSLMTSPSTICLVID